MTGPRLLVLLAAAWILPACGAPGPGHPSSPNPPTLMPDFSLQNVNPNAVPTGNLVSPRDYLGKVSAWYFGHAT